MIFTIQIKIEDLFLANLCEIDIPKEEGKSALDAFKCEKEYNGLDMSIAEGDIIWLKNS